MKENFIETISIAARPYIFRYELNADYTYTVTVLNHREIAPFSMALQGNRWALTKVTDNIIMATEQALSDAITANNEQSALSRSISA